MTLQPGQQYSGGSVVDADGREVIVLQQPQGTLVKTDDGGTVDVDGRRLVVVDKAT